MLILLLCSAISWLTAVLQSEGDNKACYNITCYEDVKGEYRPLQGSGYNQVR